MINAIDNLINRVTMYRLLLYYLVVVILAAMLFGALGIISYSPYAIAISTGIAVGTCFLLNYIFAKLFTAPTNWESAVLTGLILALVITPLASIKDVPFLLAASGLAIAIKYVVAVKNKHIFNPVAIAVVLTAFGPQESASWWVGTTWLLPFVIVGGLLIVRKIRRMSMAFAFFATALISTVLFTVIAGRDVATILTATLLHSSLFFLGFVMLTEPATSPTTKRRRLIYAVIVGILFAPALHIGSIYSTPELALVIGNLVAFFITPIVKTKVRAVATTMFGQRTQDIRFVSEYPFTYKPGQYIEMTLPHDHPDARGLRRYFTLASSPTEKDLHLGIRYYENGSTFKQALREPTQHMMAFGQVGGDFVMPNDTTKKLAFIAGGIGVTPFRSMVKYLSDMNERRDVTLLYAERSDQDIAYKDVFEEARQKVGVKTLYMLDSQSAPLANSVQARLTPENIAKLVPDFVERTFYVSGPQPMVRDMKKNLRGLGVPAHQIEVDYFSGYA